MKKVILFVMSFFFLVGIVNADAGTFKSEWETEKTNMYNEGELNKYYFENNIVSVGDGFVNSVVFLDSSETNIAMISGVVAGVPIDRVNALSNYLFGKKAAGELLYDRLIFFGWAYGNSASTLNYYDASGNKVNSKKLSNDIVLDLNSDGNYVYSLEMVKGTTYIDEIYSYDAVLYLRKYDKDLNEVASFKLDNFIEEYIRESLYDLGLMSDELDEETFYLLTEVKAVIGEFSILSGVIGINPIDFKNDKVNIFSLIELDKDLKNPSMSVDIFEEYLAIMEARYDIEEFETEEERIEFVMGKVEDLCDKYETQNPRLVGFIRYLYLYYMETLDMRNPEVTYIESNLPLGYAYGSKYNVAGGAFVAESIEDELNSKDYAHLFISNLSASNPIYVGMYARLIILDHDNNVVLTKDDKDYVAFYNVQAVGDYITCLGLRIKDVPKGINSILDAFTINDSYHVNSDLLIFDKDGNLVQKLSNGKLNTNYKMDDKKVMLSGMNIRNVFTEVSYDGEKANIGVFGDSSTTIYRFAYVAKAIQNDGGNIVIPEAVVPGDVVDVTILPKKGYTFDYLLVTYPDGRTEKIKDTSFVMPNDDVTVEAIYKVGNPNTGDIMIITTILVLIVSCVVLVYKSRRKKLYW